MLSNELISEISLFRSPARTRVRIYQCSPRSRQRAYVMRQSIRTDGHYGAWGVFHGKSKFGLDTWCFNQLPFRTRSGRRRNLDVISLSSFPLQQSRATGARNPAKPMRRIVLVFLLVSWFVAAQQAKTRDHPTSARASGKALFLQHCASCHGDGLALPLSWNGVAISSPGSNSTSHSRSGMEPALNRC